MLPQVINGCTLEALYVKLEEGNLPPKARSLTVITCMHVHTRITHTSVLLSGR